MKLVILTSSIFYLLGLKMTHNIEITQKSAVDTVKITIQEENLPKVDEKKSLIIEPDKAVKEMETPSPTGSSQLTAPKPCHPIDKVS